MEILAEQTLKPFASHIRFHIVEAEEPLFLFRVINSDINDEQWAEAMTIVKKFVRWVQDEKIRYHFFFDIHECDMIPGTRLLELQKYLKKKRDVMQTHLHSSVVVTRNKVVEMALTTALGLIKPTRPMLILLAPTDFRGERNEFNLPVSTWTKALDFFENNKLKK